MKKTLIWTAVLLLGTAGYLWGFSMDMDVCSLINTSMYCTCDLFGLNQAHTVSCFLFGPVTPNHSVWTSFNQQREIRSLSLTSRVNASLTFIPTVALRTTPFLENVVFHDGRLDILWPYSFVNMTHLQNISLERNDITALELFTFSFLPNLTKIILSENQIKRLPAEAFYRLPKMKFLFMDRNNLSVIDDNAFADLPGLVELDLNENNIEQLTSKTFMGLGNLKRLDLSRNKMTRLVDDIFTGTPRLNDLDLYDNLIEDINDQAFRGLGHLNSLKLNSNRIKQLLDNVFKGTPNLMIVDLTRNRLQTFRKDILTPLNYSRKAQFVMFLKENALQCSCDILWFYIHFEKSPSHLFRKEVRELKCKRDNDLVRIKKVSSQELGCPETTLRPRVTRPKQKPPFRLRATLPDLGTTTTTTAESLEFSVPGTETKMPNWLVPDMKSDDLNSNRHVPDTSSVAIVYNSHNVSHQQQAAEVRPQNKSPNSRTNFIFVSLIIVFSLWCSRNM